MTVKLIKIRNVLGVADIEFEPGKVTEISGRNASGKSSILNAIRSVAKVGGDATLLRAGEEQGEVVLVLDNDTEIGRKFTEARTYPYARQGKMSASSPASFIANLTGQYALNPIDFIMADDKKRIEYLLSCIDVQHDIEALKQITGLEVPKNTNMGPIELIDALRSKLYDDRTGLNRACKESSAAVAQLEKSLPEKLCSADELKAERNEAVRKVNEIVAAAKEKIEVTARDLDKRAKSIDDEAKLKIENANTHVVTRIDAIDLTISELQQEKASLRNNFAEFRATVDRNANEETSELQNEAATKRVDIQNKANEEAAGLRESVSHLEAKIEEAGRVENTLQIVAQNKAQAEKLDREAKQATKRIVKLDEYKAKQLEALPVPGLTVVEGKLLLGELPFENVNMAEKVRIAFELARMQAGELGLICVDGLELLDRLHYDELIERAKNSDVQLIITAVTDNDLTIKA